MTLIHEPDLDSFSEYENNFFFLLAYVLVLCLKGFFCSVCLLVYSNILFSVFFELNIVSRKPCKALIMIISVIKYF